MGNSKGIFLICAVAVSLLCGCSKKVGDFDFQNLGKEENSTTFYLNMDDSLSIYDIYLYTRYKFQYDEGTLPAVITITSPSGEKGSEVVRLQGNYKNIKEYLRENGEQNNILLAQTSDYYDIKELYRTNIAPKELGKWEIEIYIPNTDNVMGVGIECNSRTRTK